MITNVPTADEFIERADALLHLSYSIVSKLYDNQREDGRHCAEEEDLREYWDRCAPSLANALALLQQAHELYLKGRVAEVSPYFLLARDPQQWPKHRYLPREPYTGRSRMDIRQSTTSQIGPLVCADGFGAKTLASWPFSNGHWWHLSNRSSPKQPAAMGPTTLTGEYAVHPVVGWQAANPS